LTINHLPFTSIFISILFLPITLWGQSDNESLRLLFVGDVMAHDLQIESAEVIRNKVYDFNPTFQYVSPIIKEADLAIANLEVTLLGKPPYNGFPTFRCPDEMAYALRDAGFDVLLTANNHSNDFGRRGLVKTIDTVEDLGFYQTGSFRNARERELHYPLIVYKKGFKLAFLNYTYRSNNSRVQSPTLLNSLKDMEQIQTDMETAHKLKPDAIIVLVHWGKEYEIEENEYQQKVAHQLFDWGADLIVGAHPHVVQPVKEYRMPVPRSKDKRVVAAYSLGNFISNQDKKNTDGGLMFEVTLRKNGQGKAIIQDHKYIPVWRYIANTENKKVRFHCLPISYFENDYDNTLDMPIKDIYSMNKYAKNLRDHLKKYDSSERLLKFEPKKVKVGQ